jgi:hypothetical protein
VGRCPIEPGLIFLSVLCVVRYVPARMQKFLPLLLLTLSFPSLRAELVVYRENERAHLTTAGREIILPVTSYWVYDTTTRTVDFIGYFKIRSHRIYAITNSNKYLVRQGLSGRLGDYTVLTRIATSNDLPNTLAASYFAKGRESSIDLGNGNTASFPRSLKATTRTLEIVDGNLATYESSSTLVLVITETKIANSSGETAAMVIERIRQRLEAQGYSPAN